MAIPHRLLALLAALCAGPAVAADPFVPIHQPPPCSAAINRGAQAALDQMVTGSRINYDIKAGGSQSSAEQSNFNLELKMAAYRKAAELITFAQQRYGCTPLLLMPLP